MKRPALRGGVGVSLGLHAVLIVAAIWHWQTTSLIATAAQTSLTLVFEAPAETTRVLPGAVMTRAQVRSAPGLSAPTRIFVPARPSIPRSMAAVGGQVHAAHARGGPQAATPLPVTAAPARPAYPPPDLAAIGAFESQVQVAVQGAAVYPATARLQHRQGRARVRFTYDGGHAIDAVVQTSSDSAILDRAALGAVQRAGLPPAPMQIASRRLDLLVWVSFRLDGALD